MSSNNSKRGRDKFKRFEPIIQISAKFFSAFPMSFRKKIYYFFQNTKGLKGIGIRYILLKSISQKIGNNISIHPGVYFFELENLEIGDNVSIHPMCYIEATGKIIIGNDISIAHGTTILSTTHKYTDDSIPIKDQGIKLNPTIIQDNVWIGSKATIMDGIIVESGSVIAAGAVVTKDVESNTVVAGVPAKIIKSRKHTN